MGHVQEARVAAAAAQKYTIFNMRVLSCNSLHDVE